MAPSEKDFNVYVGTETGILKGVNLNQKAVIMKNFNKIKSLDLDQEITAMTWGDEEEIEVVMGLRNQTLRTFDTDVKAFVSSRNVNVGKGPIVSLGRLNGVTITAMKSGEINLWCGEKPVEIKALGGGGGGEYLSRMRQSPVTPHLLATGGKESDLQLWDLHHPEQPTFRAKNVKPDMLELRIPVWVTDIAYLEGLQSVAISSRHKHVRLYDPNRQRRPTISFEWGESPLTSICSIASNVSQVVVGTAHGHMGLFDLRGKKAEVPLRVYKGFSGAVKDIRSHSTLPLVFSVSLDRFLRVHHLDTGKVLFNEYLKSRLNCLLVREKLESSDFIAVTQKSRKRKTATNDSEEAKKQALESSEIHDDDDWESLTK